jgi:hypothetical protein
MADQRDKHGRFKAGNKAARGKIRTEEELVQMAKTATPRLMRRLIAIATDPQTVPATAVRASELIIERGHGRSFASDKPQQAEPVAGEAPDARVALAAILARLDAEAERPAQEPQPILDQLESPRRLPRGTIDRAAPELKPEPFDPKAPSRRELQQGWEIQGGQSKVLGPGSPFNDQPADIPAKFLKWT